MKSALSVAVVIAAATALAACASLWPGSAGSGSRTLMIALTGAAEGPGLGDPERSNLYRKMKAFGIAPARLSHIHRSPVGEAGGPIVVQLEPPTDGDSEDCMAIAPELARSLLDNPAAYYVNVHNEDHPGGAVRGQLG